MTSTAAGARELLPMPAAGAQGVVSAPVLRRLAGGGLDVFLLGIGLAFVLGTELAIATEEAVTWVAMGWTLVFAPLYFGLYHGFGTGATPGQRELRIGLRDERTGQTTRPARAIVRAYLGFLFLLLVVPAAIDLVVLAGTRRSLRDRLTHTTATRIELAGVARELDAPTTSAFAALFEPPSGTRRYLRRGWRLLRARPRVVLGPVAALYAVLVVIAFVLAVLFTDSFDEYTVALFALFAFVLAMTGVYWAQAVVVTATEQIRVGDPEISIWATLVRASRRANALTAALVVLLLLPWIVLFTFFLMLPVLARLTMVAPALVLEDRRVFGAFGRSWRLTRRQTWRLFGLLLLSYLVLGAVYASIVVGATTASFVGAVPTGIAFVVAVAWLGAAWSLVYEDARRASPAGGAP